MKIFHSYTRHVVAITAYIVFFLLFVIVLHVTGNGVYATVLLLFPIIAGLQMPRRFVLFATASTIIIVIPVQHIVYSIPVSLPIIILYGVMIVSSIIISIQSQSIFRNREQLARAMWEHEMLNQQLQHEKDSHAICESLLHDREGLYLNLVETIPHGIGVLDKRGVISYANRASHEIFGYEKGQMAGEMIFNLMVAKSDRIEMHDFIMNLLNGSRTPDSYLYKFRTNDNRIIDVQIDWNYNRDMDGTINGLIAVFTDVTRRIDAERELEFQKIELHKRLRETNCLYSISQILGNSDPMSDDTFSRVVEILRNGFTFPESTVISLRINDRQFVTADFVFKEPHLQSDIYVHDIRAGIIDVCYTGKQSPLNGSPFIEEEKKMLHEISYQIGNVVEKKKTEDALIESETQAQAIFNVSTETIAMISPDGKIVNINDIGARRFWDKKENLIGSMLYKYLPKETRRPRIRQINEVLQTGNPVRFQDTQYGYTYDINIQPVFKDNGELQYIAIFASDITPIMKLQETIISISERERQQLGQDLHDDLGQHLTGISYLITGLRQKLQDKQYGEAQDALHISHQIKSVIERLRKLSRGLCPISIEKEGFIDALKEMCSEVESIFSIPCRFHIEGDINIPDSIKAVNLFYIAQESVNNALKHAHPNVVDVRIVATDDLFTMTIQNDFGAMHESVTGKPGIGIEVMKYRANLIGGSLDIIEEEEIFTVSVHVPV